MSHAAENIVASVISILTAAATVAGNSVYGSPDVAIAEDDNDGAVIAVFEGDEESELHSETSNSIKARWLELFVELHFRGSVVDPKNPRGVDTAANDFLRQVEVALEADQTLGGKCLTFKHTNTKRERDSKVQSLRVYTLRLVVQYRTARTNPSTLA